MAEEDLGPVDLKPADGEGTENDFEVLSHIDPEDEFLQSEKSFSLIEKLSMGQSLNDESFDVLSPHSSQFSILEGSKLHGLLKSLRSEQGDQSMSLNNIESGTDNERNATLSDLLNSSKFSVVVNERDSYAEDIVL